VTTSYGFLLLTEGRTLAALTLGGTFYWQYSFRERPDFFSADTDDFVYAVTGGRVLHKINPSGRLLWNVDTREVLRCPPLPGRDGRVFAASDRALLCYDTRGRLRWKQKIPPPAFPPLELNDGTLLVISGEGGASSGLRISPFGEYIEEITLSGTVTGAAVVEAGALLTFSSGLYGLCAVKDNRASSSWTGNTGKGASGHALPLGSGSRAALLSSREVLFLAPNAGETREIPRDKLRINLGDLALGALYGDTLVLGDSQGAAAFRAHKEGPPVTLWEAALPPRGGWDYLAYSPEGLLLVCGADWVASAYRVCLGEAPPRGKARRTYREFIRARAGSLGTGLDRIDRRELAEIGAGLASSGPGERELRWQERLAFLSSRLSRRYEREGGTRVDNGELFPAALADTALLVQTLGKAGSGRFCPVIAGTIRRDPDPVMVRYALRAAEETAYDPEGDLLDAAAWVCRKAALYPPGVHIAACDAVYAICSYMGQRAFAGKGKGILETYTGPLFPVRIRMYAAGILKKLAKR
jgi:hypothetical protein